MLQTKNMDVILYALFFLSGFSALTYQLMWQRMLFIQFGVDLESVTLIVSVFMFGLGLGGLWGGMLADKWLTKLLRVYVLIEMGIATFGFLSPNLIDTVGNLFFNSHRIVTALTSFLMLAIPTILMGATFPILVTHVNRYVHNIGRSVGGLYCVNTLGGAVGVFLSGFCWLNFMDMTKVIYLAAVINLLVALIAYLYYKRARV